MCADILHGDMQETIVNLAKDLQKMGELDAKL